VLELARELGIAARETGLLWERMYQADEVFLCGTTTEVLPVATVDGRPIGAGGAGPVTSRLLKAFRERLPG
jgi:branched-chain amino acid aminotransferase